MREAAAAVFWHGRMKCSIMNYTAQAHCAVVDHVPPTCPDFHTAVCYNGMSKMANKMALMASCRAFVLGLSLIAFPALTQKNSGDRQNNSAFTKTVQEWVEIQTRRERSSGEDGGLNLLKQSRTGNIAGAGVLVGGLVRMAFLSVRFCTFCTLSPRPRGERGRAARVNENKTERKKEGGWQVLA